MYLPGDDGGVKLDNNKSIHTLYAHCMSVLLLFAVQAVWMMMEKGFEPIFR